MRLKSFYAKTMTEAMQMVRDMLGEDAIIVATREEKGGKAVHVTAAVEPGFKASRDDDPAFEVGRKAGRETDNNWLQYDDEDEESAVTEEITDSMLRHGVPEDVMDNIISCATVIGFDEPSVALVAALEHLFHFEALESHETLMLVGPPGAGKTLAAAKIATQAVMNGEHIGVITTDTVRAGGAEQLSAFTKLLKLKLQKADSAQDLQDQISELQAMGCSRIIIDSYGTNPFDRDDIKELAKMIGSISLTPTLVLPGALDAAESGDMARAFASIGVQNILPTRIDMARRLGGILSAAHHGGFSFTSASHTPKVADGLFQLTPKTLSNLIMPGSYGTEDASSHKRTQSKAQTPSNRKRIKQ